jgi:hypothetical protein
MTKKMKEQKKLKKGRTTSTEESLKQLPLPPEEHAYELKMEKRLKRMLKEQENTRPCS